MDGAGNKKCGDCRGWAVDRIAPYSKDRGSKINGPAGDCLPRATRRFAEEPACPQFLDK